MKKWQKFLKSESRYLLIFILTGIIVSILATRFGLIKSRYVYHLVNHILRTILR